MDLQKMARIKVSGCEVIYNVKHGPSKEKLLRAEVSSGMLTNEAHTLAHFRFRSQAGLLEDIDVEVYGHKTHSSLGRDVVLAHGKVVKTTSGHLFKVGTMIEAMLDYGQDEMPNEAIAV